MNTELLKIAHIGSRTRSEDEFLYTKVQFILVPPSQFQLVSPHYVCSSDGLVVVYQVHHTHALPQRRCAQGFLLITII